MARPRIRSLKPEMWADEKIGALSRDARLLFIGLITMADDEGRLRALHAAILGHVFPYDADAPKKLEGWLRELDVGGLILTYNAGGVAYLAVARWGRHQKINRGVSSQLPPPPDAEVAEGNAVTPYDASGNFKKTAIPEKVRRGVAKRAGAIPGETVNAPCHWCSAEGSIHWARLADGRPGSWVSFRDLELDHVIPESKGGATDEDNLVLSCPPCNRTRGNRDVPARDTSLDSVSDDHGTSHAQARVPDPDPDPDPVVEDTGTTVAREAARSKAVDPDTLPSDFPPGLTDAADRALDRLTALYDERGGSVPTLRGVGMALKRFPDRDHAAVVAELEHWSLAGRGARQTIKDWPKTLATFLERTPAGKPTLTAVPGGAGNQQWRALLDGGDAA